MERVYGIAEGGNSSSDCQTTVFITREIVGRMPKTAYWEQRSKDCMGRNIMVLSYPNIVGRDIVILERVVSD